MSHPYRKGGCGYHRMRTRGLVEEDRAWGGARTGDFASALGCWTVLISHNPSSFYGKQLACETLNVLHRFYFFITELLLTE